MKPNVLIFVERMEDAVFLQACIQSWFPAHKDDVPLFNQGKNDDMVRMNTAFNEYGSIIFSLGSQSKLKPFLKLENNIVKRRLASKHGLNILVVFDADKPDATDERNLEHGGNAAKRAYILSIANDTKTPLQQEHIFLFPDNSSDGTLENLLESCIPSEHNAILECWKDYSQCLIESGYKSPSDKTKIFSYAEIQTTYNDAFGNKRIYNGHHWNLDHTSEYLQPLYTFLKPYFESTSIP